MNYKDLTPEDYLSIDQAATYIGDYCRRYGRISAHAKEKWGTVRVYVTGFGHINLHQLVYPGFAYCQFPRWLWIADLYVFGPILQKLFGGLMLKWQVMIYRRAYIKALKKWPKYKGAITLCMDYPEFVNLRKHRVNL